jgi:predicted nuclease of predicted toxin-antitoxin system
MRFLAGESCDFAVVRALLAAGHDVVAVAEIAPQAADETVIELAVREGCLLVTEDKDFGQLVYAAGHPTGGVVLLRFPARARASLAETVLKLVTGHGERLVGRFVVVQPGRIRIGLRYGG